MQIDDIQLGAFLDGELSADEYADIAKALQSDVALQKRLSAMEQADALLKATYGAQDSQPIAQSLIDTIKQSSQGAAPSSNVLPLSFARKPNRPLMQYWPASIAATLLVLVGATFMLSRFNGGQQNYTPQLVAAASITQDNPLYAVIEATPSAQTVALDPIHRVSAKPVMTLRLADGQICREILVTSDDQYQRALVCKQDDGWSVRIAGPTQPNTVSKGYQTASGPAGEYDVKLDALNPQTPLNADEELHIMATGWQVP
jgi:hypothetical protein